MARLLGCSLELLGSLGSSGCGARYPMTSTHPGTKALWLGKSRKALGRIDEGLLGKSLTLDDTMNI